MLANDNLLSISQTFFTPESIQKMSDLIGQSREKTMTGLKSVIPTLMNGIVDKGITQEGAAKLVDMINTHDFELIKKPDENKLKEGHEAIKNIFGSNLSRTVSKLETSTGLGINQIVKMLDMAAPVFMGLLGAKVKYENTSSLGIMHFLLEQKIALSGFSSTKHLRRPKFFSMQSQDIPWKSVLLFALVLFGIYFWWLAANNIPSPPVAVTENGAVITKIYKTTPIRDLERFFIEATEKDLPKHFKFERLHFVSGEVGIARGSEAELMKIAETLKKNPTAQVRIEGFTDNIGPEERNRRLSEARAMHVKNSLVSLGIESDRVQVIGYGSANPVANNSFAHGRAANNRVELVVSRIK